MGTIDETTRAILLDAEEKIQDEYFFIDKKIILWETSWKQLLAEKIYVTAEKEKVRDKTIEALQAIKKSLSKKLQDIDTRLRPPLTTHHNEHKEKVNSETEDRNQTIGETNYPWETQQGRTRGDEKKSF